MTGGTLLLLLPFAATLVVGVYTPWVLGDEQSVACYTLSSQEDIPRPAGLEMYWSRLPSPLTSSLETTAGFVVLGHGSFWSHASNRALLGDQYDRYYRLCLNETGGCDATGDCCIWHSNVHSCRAETSNACEPWVAPANASDGGYTLVTHTPSLVGGFGLFQHPLQLPVGDWVIIAHVKIMTFQCAVGATRQSQEHRARSPNIASRVIFIVIAVIVVGSFIGAGIHSLMKANVPSRDECAPQPRDGAVTLLFTDIQDSTNLWSKYPASMAVTQDIHHEVIRRCISRHKAYEVKTAGDAFMIAHNSAENGVFLAVDIQTELMSEQWPRCITQHYLGVELDDEPELRERAEPSDQFFGCRVRIGVHTGALEMVRVAKGYDYTGAAVNFAACVEAASQGGQILCSKEVEDQLQAMPVTVSVQGTILPKGSEDVHEVFTIQSTAFPSRDFPQIAYEDGEGQVEAYLSKFGK